MILACQNIRKSFGEKEVLKNISFHIDAREKCAITGPNGAGKTTLLKIILGQEMPDSGQVIMAKDVSLGYLSQQENIAPNSTVLEAMQEAKPIPALRQKIASLEAEMTHLTGDQLSEVMERYNRLTTKYDQENGYAYESEVNGILKGLGFSTADYDRSVSSLSGGQKMRILLGRLLLSRPDILLLDEPTNHLDMPSIDWLEGFLSGYSGAVMTVSHDRYFIDKISTKIIEIDQGISTIYEGNYTYYREARAKIRRDKIRAYLKQQDEIHHEEEVITKLKSFNREKSIRRAESREKKLDKIQVLDKPTETDVKMRFKLTPVTESGEDVLKVEHLSKSFGTNTLFTDLSMEIMRGEHVALIGGNGTGKTTILKIINRMIPKNAGTVTLGSRVRIGYFDQEHQELEPDNTIFDEIQDTFPDMNNTKIRNVLAAFLFTGDDVFKKIGDLSGGEKGRLALAKLMLSPANFLILDEPTNHLDIPSKEILEDAIRDYTGTVLMVSHERYFINQTATRILELRNKVLTSYKGNYDFYMEHRDEYYDLQNGNNVNADQNASVTRSGFSIVSTAAYAEENKSTGKQAYLAGKEAYAARRKKENKIKRIEKDIENKENKIREIDAEMLLPENGCNAELLGKLSEERTALSESLEDLYTTWDELQV